MAANGPVRFALVDADYGLNAGYGDVTASHLAASMAALEELSSLVSTAVPQEGVQGQYVRLGLYDHGSSLNGMLFGFAVRVSLGRTEIPRADSQMGPRPPAHVLQSPITTEDLPLLYGIVANHPVEVQIQHTISFLARLVGRRVVTSEMVSKSGSEIDSLGTEIDIEADKEVSDLLRTKGWRAAAQSVRVRAQASRTPLIVHASPELMTAEQIKLQIPIVRRVYNESPTIRRGIDTLVTLLSQGMTVVGGSNAEVAGFLRDFLDLGLQRTYMAHVVRDAYVCGNGYLLYGSAPDEDMRLLRPEDVLISARGEFIERTPSGDIAHTNVLHMTGASQPNSPYGISLLEPFVGLQIQREIAEQMKARAHAWNSDDVPKEFRGWALERLPAAERMLATVESESRAILGPVLEQNLLQISVPEALYFRGYEQVTPAAEGITVAVPDSDGSEQ